MHMKCSYDFLDVGFRDVAFADPRNPGQNIMSRQLDDLWDNVLHAVAPAQSCHVRVDTSFYELETCAAGLVSWVNGMKGHDGCWSIMIKVAEIPEMLVCAEYAHGQARIEPFSIDVLGRFDNAIQMTPFNVFWLAKLPRLIAILGAHGMPLRHIDHFDFEAIQCEVDRQDSEVAARDAQFDNVMQAVALRALRDKVSLPHDMYALICNMSTGGLYEPPQSAEGHLRARDDLTGPLGDGQEWAGHCVGLPLCRPSIV